MDSWERTISWLLTTLRLSSLRSKIVFFAILSTLIPSISMGWISYRNNRQILEEKITQELVNLTSHAGRELKLWFRDRHYEMRVFTSSYEVSENLEKVSSLSSRTAQSREAATRLQEYITSVEARFKDFEELQVIDLEGNLVASSSGPDSDVTIPDEWLVQLESGKPIDEAHKKSWDAATRIFQIAEPIHSAVGEPLGLMAAKIRFNRIDEILQDQSTGITGNIYLVTLAGVVLATSTPDSTTEDIALQSELARSLFAHRDSPLSYSGLHGLDVVGILKPLSGLGWGVVAELEEAHAYGRIVRLRNATMLVVSLTVLGITLAGYLLGMTIVRPLDRLNKGASSVAGGDLSVDLPVHGSGEVAYLTEVFNKMVSSIRQGKATLDELNQNLLDKNEELHEIAITDSLTGINNRKHLMETLTREVSRSLRQKHFCSIVMIDVDHFKKFNDTHGHLAGDKLLRSIAQIIRTTIRDVDYAARYGGEEFVVILPETDADQAKEISGRVRKKIAEHRPGSGADFEKITASFGISTFPGSGDGSESLLKEADAAMYRAKKGGRNRVVVSKSALSSRNPAAT